MNPKHKKLLLAVLAVPVIGLAGYQAYSFTSALFTDTETNTANVFTAGTLDMSVGGHNGEAFDSFSISNIGANGVVSGGKEWTITNNGTVPGNLTFKLNDLKNYENACNEPEAKADTTCNDPNDPNDPNILKGELGNAIHTTVDIDTNNDGTYDQTAVVSSDLASADQSQYATQWNAHAGNSGTLTIQPGQSVKVKMNWSTDPASYGNEIQSDSLTFGVQYDLTQVTPVNVTPTP